MDRTRRIEKLLGMLAHAEADTPEGRAARTLAARFQARYQISEAELAQARARRDIRARTQVVLDGWAEPWLVDLAFLIAAVSGCSAQVVATPGTRALQVQLVGAGDGEAAERAHQVRAVVSAAVDRAGGDVGVRRLRVRRSGHNMLLQSIGWGFASTSAVGTAHMVVGGYDLATTFGGSALTVYRMSVTRQVLAPELERFRRDMEERERQKARVAGLAREEAFRAATRRPPDGVREEGPGRSSSSARAAESEPPPSPAPPPPPESEDERAARVAAQDLLDLTLRLAHRVKEVVDARPAWLDEAVPVVPGALVAGCA